MIRKMFIGLVVLGLACGTIVLKGASPVSASAPGLAATSSDEPIGISTITGITGRKLWAQRYDGPRHGRDDATALAVSPDGSTVFVTGGSEGSSGDQYATVAYQASTGRRLWASRYEGSWSPAALAVSPSGSAVFVTGSAPGQHGLDYATVAYDASTGSELWVRTYDGYAQGSDNAAAVAVSPDGSTVFVTGTGYEDLGYRYTTLAYRASDGKTRWMRTFNPADYGVAEALVVSPDGSKVFVTGTAYDSRATNFATVAFGARTGKYLWGARFDGRGHFEDDASAIGIAPDGRTVFVTGRSDGLMRVEFATVAYSVRNGKRRWVAHYDGSTQDNYPTALGVSTDSSTVFVTGTSRGSDGSACATVAYDAKTRAKRWVARYDGAGGGAGCGALAVAPGGAAVFVAGASGGPNGSDYATLAYDESTGAQLWVRRYDGPKHSDDFAEALGIAPDGSTLFVTGGSQGRNDDDYATVAYQAA